MVVNFIKLLTVAAMFELLAITAAAADPSLSGYWKDSDGEVIVDIQPCGDAVCGKVAWLRLPNGPDGKALLDYRNPDPSLRSRPVCGLQVITGMKKQDDGTFGGGSVYVSDLGLEFKGKATQIDNDRMEVRGYVGISLFGQTEVWTRTAAPADICGKANAAAPTQTPTNINSSKPAGAKGLSAGEKTKPAAARQ